MPSSRSTTGGTRVRAVPFLLLLLCAALLAITSPMAAAAAAEEEALQSGAAQVASGDSPLSRRTDAGGQAGTAGEGPPLEPSDLLLWRRYEASLLVPGGRPLPAVWRASVYRPRRRHRRLRETAQEKRRSGGGGSDARYVIEVRGADVNGLPARWLHRVARRLGLVADLDWWRRRRQQGLLSSRSPAEAEGGRRSAGAPPSCVGYVSEATLRQVSARLTLVSRDTGSMRAARHGPAPQQPTGAPSPSSSAAVAAEAEGEGVVLVPGAIVSAGDALADTRWRLEWLPHGAPDLSTPPTTALSSAASAAAAFGVSRFTFIPLDRPSSSSSFASTRLAPSSAGRHLALALVLTPPAVPTGAAQQRGADPLQVHCTLTLEVRAASDGDEWESEEEEEEGSASLHTDDKRKKKAGTHRGMGSSNKSTYASVVLIAFMLVSRVLPRYLGKGSGPGARGRGQRRRPRQHGSGGLFANLLFRARGAEGGATTVRAAGGANGMASSSSSPRDSDGFNNARRSTSDVETINAGNNHGVPANLSQEEIRRRVLQNLGKEA